MAQIIMVPRSNAPLPRVQFMETRTINVSTPNDPFAHKHLEELKTFELNQAIFDPWYDYRRWYRLEIWNDFTFTDRDVESKLWNFDDLHRFIDTLPGIVLVQPHSDGWRLAFKDETAQRAFRDWWNGLRKDFAINVSIPSNQLKEFEGWMASHLTRGGWTCREGSWRGDRKEMRVVIRDQLEATEFKLRWYNVPEEETA